MHVIVVGINFKTADVSIREKFCFSSESLPLALTKLNNYPSIKGSVILSTCNRVEIYATVEKIEEGIKNVIDFISEHHAISVQSFMPFIYSKYCQSAAMHLFRVSSGLDSMVVGEYQVQGQVRDAYFLAKENNATNGMLNKLFQLAIQSGKRVRSETSIGEGTISAATLAVEIVKKTFKEKSDFNVLLIGAGKMSLLAAANFQKQFKGCKISVTNRSTERAVELADQFQGTVIDFDKKLESIIDNDIIIASTSADSYVVCKDEMLSLNGAIQSKRKIFIDLSIPRNIDPEINSVENCLVYSMDDINKEINSNLDKRASEAINAEKIIKEIAQDYFDWYAKQSRIPSMLEIKKELILIKQNTMSCNAALFDSLDQNQKEVIEKMLDIYTGKIIQVIMRNHKKPSGAEVEVPEAETQHHHHHCMN